MTIAVGEVEYASRGVDTMDDVEDVERMWRLQVDGGGRTPALFGTRSSVLVGP